MLQEGRRQIGLTGQGSNTDLDNVRAELERGSREVGDDYSLRHSLNYA